MLSNSYILAKTDLELINLYKLRGDKQIVGELYKRYTRFAFLICMKYLKNEESSKDAVMQVFEKLFDDLKKHQIVNFKSWLYSVIKNHCLHIIRDNSYKSIKEKEVLNSYEEFVENQLDLYQFNDNGFEQKIQTLEMELCNLPHEQKTCIELFYLKDKCYQEVAEITGYTMNQVKSYIQNGKRNLKISMQQNERE